MVDLSSHEEFFWFCLRSRPKREHIAAAHLRQLENVEVYCPRIRFERMTVRGPVWFTEALFPGYLFARFNVVASQKLVTYANGVSGIVHFGTSPTVVPSEAVTELRAHLGEKEFLVAPTAIQEGDEVVVTSGIFKGLQTLVNRVMPGAERVRILLEFLGQCREIEISRHQLFRKESHVLAALVHRTS